MTGTIPRWVRQAMLLFTCRAIAGLVAGCGLAQAATGGEASARSATASDTGHQLTLDSFGQLPLSFEVNNGQSGPSVRYLARGPGYSVFLTPGEVILGVQQPVAASRTARSGSEHRRRVIRTRFEGAQRVPAIAGEARQQHESNYFTGSAPAQQFIRVANYARVRYTQLYPGIDLVFYGNQRQLEYDFVVAPGADPRRIRLAIDGADKVTLDQEGDLLLHTDAGVIRQHRPVIYQMIDGQRRDIDGRYVLSAKNRVGIQVAAYDTSLPLIIDPVLSYSSYLGGKAQDTGMAIAVDATGNAYVTGYTNSSDFPLLGQYDRSIGNGDTDIFVTKINSTGTALVYSTYLGGRNGRDYAFGVAVDAAGSAYVTGTTTGSDYPTTAGAYQAGIAAGGSFVTKLAPAGNALAYSTYVHNVSVRGIALDNSGSAYLTGSAVAGFQTTPGAYQTAFRSNAGTNAFVLKLNPAGSASAYATYLGGSGIDLGNGIAVDGHGNAYVGGKTNSADFPLADAYQPALRGASDGFVTRIGPAGNVLGFSTYLGGTLNDSVNAIALDPGYNVYLAGETYSADFPVKNAFQPVKAGKLLINSSTGSAFVTKLSASGNDLVYSSFLGGEVCTSTCQVVIGGAEYEADAAFAIAVDASGHAFVTGLAKSYTFPRVDSLLPAKTQDSDNSLFVTKVAMAGNALLYSTLIRQGYSPYADAPNGKPMGAGKGIALDAAGSAYVVSDADESNVFSTTAGSFQPVLAGGFGQDAIVLKLSASPAGVTLTSLANPVDAPASVTLRATVANSNLSGNVTFLSGAGQLGTVPLAGGVAELTTTLPAGVHVLSAIFRGSGTADDSPLMLQVVHTAGACN